MATLLSDGIHSLLITLEYDQSRTLEYDQSRMQGSPFSVAEREVRILFDPDFLIETLSVFHVRAEIYAKVELQR